jgi:hypothetical protein|tara:strand:+ start:554 stop:805 length:252 start_codon:yes stop_codon:yes gene_type:complete
MKINPTLQKKLQSQYEADVVACREAIFAFMENGKPNYMPVKLGEAYELIALDAAMTELSQAEDKLNCLYKFVEEEINGTNRAP